MTPQLRLVNVTANAVTVQRDGYALDLQLDFGNLRRRSTSAAGAA
jgi:hypothetical protein